MTRLQILSVACIVTGCSDHAPAIPLASAKIDANLSARDDPNECGYEVTETLADGDSHYQNVIFVHDAAGLVTSRFANDQDGVREWTEVNEFDAMGHAVHRTVTLPGITQQTWMAYDAFGREIRYARDRTGDGMEDAVNTFSWDDQRLVGIHFTDFAGGVQVVDDESFQYDELDRVVEIDDVGTYAGTVTFSYDDVARVMATTYQEPTVSYTGVETFDDHNRPVSASTTWTDPVSGAVTGTDTETFEYPSAALVIDTLVSHGEDGTGDATTRTEYHYGNCPNARRAGDGVARQATPRARHR